MNLKYFDKNVALKYLDNDLNLLENILQDFLMQYNNTNFCSLEDDIFFKEVHQLKSFSKNIGSDILFELANEINHNKTRLKDEFLQKVLENILNEIKDYFLKNNHDEKRSYYNLPKKQRDELILDIFNAAKKNRPKKIEESLQKLKTYKLDEKDYEYINKIEQNIRIYNFKAIVSFIEEWN